MGSMEAEAKVFSPRITLLDFNVKDDAIKDHDTTGGNVSLNYKVVRVDSTINNIAHGEMQNCKETQPYAVSFFFFKECQSASHFSDQLLEFGNIGRNFIKPHSIFHHIKTKWLMVDSIPNTTYDQWLVTNQSTAKKKVFLSELFSTIGSLHQAERYFGNLRNGIRVSNDTPVFVLPAYFEMFTLDEGIWKDLRDLRKIANELMPNDPYFGMLCEEFIGDTYDKNGNLGLKCKQISLRRGSFYITHAPLVWEAHQRYNFIRKLCDYRSLDTAQYDWQVSDIKNSPTIPGPAWQNIPASVDKSSQLRKLFEFKDENGNVAKYKHSETIRAYLRNAYEHLLLNHKRVTYMQVDQVMYNAFPNAWWHLYFYVVVRRLDGIANSMGCDIINFLQSDPHNINF